MGKIIIENAVKRKPDYLYYVDGNGDICEVPTAKIKQISKGESRKRIIKTGITKKAGCLYYVDGGGNVCAAKVEEENTQSIKNYKNLFNEKELMVLLKIMKEQTPLETEKEQIKLTKEVLSELENKNINSGTLNYLEAFIGYDVEMFEKEDIPILKKILKKIRE